MWTVVYVEQADREVALLPPNEHNAVLHAVQKLQAVGPALGYPHSSAVRAAGGELRELRPRAGRSPWRLLYQRIGDAYVIAALAPEANHDRRGFTRAVRRAHDRLAELAED